MGPDHLLAALLSLAKAVGVACALAAGLAWVLRVRGLRWTWALTGLPVGLLALPVDHRFGMVLLAACVLGTAIGASWHRRDLVDGNDFADRARERLGIRHFAQRHLAHRQAKSNGWITRDGLVIGRDPRGTPVTIPLHGHTLVVGATGSGKTVMQAWIAGRAIEHGHAAIVIDPKGDPLLRQEVRAATQCRGARLLEWTPGGPCAYNPYAHGGDTEIADKALAGELFTEPHYLRQAQRYLGHTIRTMTGTGVPVTPASLMAHLDPAQLDVATRGLEPGAAGVVQGYLDGLGERQRRELAGVRDRLSILAESDIAKWLDTSDGLAAIDLEHVVKEGGVAYFCLEADRWPLLAKLLGAAIVSDLVTIAGRRRGGGARALVVIDEFAAIAAEQVSRLFGRARSAGMSVLLGTQELADLRTDPDGRLQDQVLGNVSALVAHRQNVPASAELIAGIAGTRAAWVHTQRVDYSAAGAGVSNAGTKTRGHEFVIHPTAIKNLPTGHAAVIAPGTTRPATIVRMLHPNDAW